MRVASYISWSMHHYGRGCAALFVLAALAGCGGSNGGGAGNLPTSPASAASPPASGPAVITDGVLIAQRDPALLTIGYMSTIRGCSTARRWRAAPSTSPVASRRSTGPGRGPAPGTSSKTVIVRVEHGGKVGYRFLEAADFNYEYWKGHTGQDQRRR